MTYDSLDAVLLHYQEMAFFDNCTLMSVSDLSLLGNTVLYHAVALQDIDAVRVLLEHDADPNALGDMNYTPLHEAAEKGSLEMTKLLLKAGADGSLRTEFGQTPLGIAAKGKSQLIVQLLKD